MLPLSSHGNIRLIKVARHGWRKVRRAVNRILQEINHVGSYRDDTSRNQLPVAGGSRRSATASPGCQCTMGAGATLTSSGMSMKHAARLAHLFFPTCLAALLLCPGIAAATDKPTPQRQQTLLHLLKQDCGSCHGMSMKGGLGSPLTAASLADKPDDSLVATILYGRPGTAMPPWQAFMTEQEAQWLVEILKNAQTNPAQ